MTYKMKIEYLFSKIQYTMSKDKFLMQIFCETFNLQSIIENIICKLFEWNIQNDNIMILNNTGCRLFVAFKNGSRLLVTTGNEINSRGYRNNVVIIDSNLEDTQIQHAYTSAIVAPRIIEIFDMKDRRERNENTCGL